MLYPRFLRPSSTLPFWLTMAKVSNFGDVQLLLLLTVLLRVEERCAESAIFAGKPKLEEEEQEEDDEDDDDEEEEEEDETTAVATASIAIAIARS